VTVTSMIATFEEAIRPMVGPAAQLIPAAKVHTTSSARKSGSLEMVR
jgi:hypothetical protein